MIGWLITFKCNDFNFSQGQIIIIFLQVLIYSPTFFKYVFDTWLESHGRYPSTGFLSLLFSIHICDKVSPPTSFCVCLTKFYTLWECSVTAKHALGSHWGFTEFKAGKKCPKCPKNVTADGNEVTPYVCEMATRCAALCYLPATALQTNTFWVGKRGRAPSVMLIICIYTGAVKCRQLPRAMCYTLRKKGVL